jgi:hypothetical protein
MLGPALIALSTALGIVFCCAFLAAAAGAAAWRTSPPGGRTRFLGAALMAALYGGVLFGALARWTNGPRSGPGPWVFGVMALGLAAGAALAIRTGTAREALAATGYAVAAALATLIAGIWFLDGRMTLWPVGSATIVPAGVGLVAAPLLLRHLRPAAPRRAPGA